MHVVKKTVNTMTELSTVEPFYYGRFIGRLTPSLGQKIWSNMSLMPFCMLVFFFFFLVFPFLFGGG